jgi:hypothetical protein
MICGGGRYIVCRQLKKGDRSLVGFLRKRRYHRLRLDKGRRQSRDQNFGNQKPSHLSASAPNPRRMSSITLAVPVHKHKRMFCLFKLGHAGPMMRSLRRRFEWFGDCGVGLAHSEVGLAHKERKAGMMSIHVGRCGERLLRKGRSGRLEPGTEGKVVGDD